MWLKSFGIWKLREWRPAKTWFDNCKHGMGLRTRPHYTKPSWNYGYISIVRVWLTWWMISGSRWHFPGPSTAKKEVVARESFLEALNVRELSRKIQEREPNTLEDAHQMAMRLEVYAVEHEPDERLFRSRKVTEGQSSTEFDLDRLFETLRNMSETTRS